MEWQFCWWPFWPFGKGEVTSEEGNKRSRTLLNHLEKAGKSRWFNFCDLTLSPNVGGHLTNLWTGHVNSPSSKRSRKSRIARNIVFFHTPRVSQFLWDLPKYHPQSPKFFLPHHRIASKIYFSQVEDVSWKTLDHLSEMDGERNIFEVTNQNVNAIFWCWEMWQLWFWLFLSSTPWKFNIAPEKWWLEN